MENLGRRSLAPALYRRPRWTRHARQRLIAYPPRHRGTHCGRRRGALGGKHASGRSTPQRNRGRGAATGNGCWRHSFRTNAANAHANLVGGQRLLRIAGQHRRAQPTQPASQATDRWHQRATLRGRRTGTRYRTLGRERAALANRVFRPLVAARCHLTFTPQRGSEAHRTTDGITT